jgi:signal peptidase I
MVRRLVRAASWAGVLSVMLALVALAIGPHEGWFQELTVLSGSMQPTFNAGDVVVATREPVTDLRVGDIIVYTAPTPTPIVVSHRIVAVRPDGASVVVHTKGDANPVEDPWAARLPAGTVWRVRHVIPRIGWVLNWLQYGPARPVILYGCPALLALWLLVRIWRPRPSRPARPRAARSRPPRPAPRRRPEPVTASLDDLLNSGPPR